MAGLARETAPGLSGRLMSARPRVPSVSTFHVPSEQTLPLLHEQAETPPGVRGLRPPRPASLSLSAAPPAFYSKYLVAFRLLPSTWGVPQPRPHFLARTFRLAHTLRARAQLSRDRLSSSVRHVPRSRLRLSGLPFLSTSLQHSARGVGAPPPHLRPPAASQALL